MAENFYIAKVPQVNSPEVDMARLRHVTFVRKLGESAQFRAADGQLQLFLRAPQTLQQMRMAVSGKINQLGFGARVSQVSEEEFAQLFAAAGHSTGICQFVNLQILQTTSRA